MSTTTIAAEVEQAPGPGEGAFHRPSTPRPERVRFNDAQQAILDREIAKAKRKSGERVQHAVTDIRELVWACEQLLYKKLIPEQAQAIAQGVQEIKAEYGEAECRKT